MMRAIDLIHNRIYDVQVSENQKNKTTDSIFTKNL